MTRSDTAVLEALDRAIAARGAAAPLTLAGLARLLLPAWQAELDRLVGSGPTRRISCRAACAACCRHPVPLSIPEAFMLAELVDSLATAEQERIRTVIDLAARRLATAGLASAPLLSRAHEYMALGLACPFLVDECCAIHPRRPAACREHLVVSPPELCAFLDGGAEPIGFPLSLTAILAAVASRLLDGPPTQIPLIRLLDWCIENSGEARRDWPLATLRQTVAEVLRIG